MVDRSFHVLIIGGGSIGERHLRCFGRLPKVCVSLCEPHKDTRTRLIKMYDIMHVEANLEDALSHHYDAAVICTPANLHVDMAIRCASLGLNVLIEKPISTSEERLGELVSEIEKNKVICGVAYTYRSFSSVRDLHSALERKELGQIRQLTVQAGQEFPRYRPTYASTYYASHNSGGGAIQDVLTHLIDCAGYLVGPATKVCADAAHLCMHGVNVEDTVHVLARHGKILACYTLNQYQAPNETLFTIVGSSATARLEIVQNSWSIMAANSEKWKVRHIQPVERDIHFINQARYFLDAIQGKGTVTCTIKEAISTLKVTLSILESAFTEEKWQQLS